MSGGVSRWLRGAQIPYATDGAAHHHDGGRHRPLKRGRSSESSGLHYCGPQGPLVFNPAPVNGRVWYNPERKRRRKPQPLQTTRRWIEAATSSSSSSSSVSVPSGATGDRFVLLSYNVLGDDNALYHGDLYVNIPADILRWGSRKHLICQEICRWSADIVCLQEVDRYNDILVDVKKEGYAGSYKRRTGEAKDGCAIFWKEKKVHLLEEHSIEFTDFDLRNNVAQLLVFELCETSSRRVVVGNIHVLFNPKRGDIKLGQVRMLVSKAHALSEKWGGIPVVLAGDFNSTPQSAIYEFLSTSKLNINGRDRRDLSGQGRLKTHPHELSGSQTYCWSSEELKNATGDSTCMHLAHPLQMCSAYASVKSNALTRGPYGEPLATTYHSKFLGTVDYLWYSTGVASTRVLDTLPIGTLKTLGGLPSQASSSSPSPLLCAPWSGSPTAWTVATTRPLPPPPASSQTLLHPTAGGRSSRRRCPRPRWRMEEEAHVRSAWRSSRRGRR